MTILPIREFVPDHFVFMATKRGTVKKTDLMEFAIQRSNGKRAINMLEGDELIGVAITNGDNEIILASRNGLSIRFPEKQVRPMGRAATGVRGMSLEEGDEVVTMEVVDPTKTLLSVTDRGIGKRTPIEDYRVQSRGGKGIITIKTSEENGYVIGVLKVGDSDEAMLITTSGQAIRIPVSGISVIGRNTKGVRLFRVAEGEKVVSVTKIAEPQSNGSSDTEGDDEDTSVENTATS